MKAQQNGDTIVLNGIGGDKQKTTILFKKKDFCGYSYTDYEKKYWPNFLTINIQGIKSYLRCTPDELLVLQKLILNNGRKK